MKFRLTKRQREILERMAKDDPEDTFVYETGGGWWMGCDQTNGKTGLFLLRACLIKPDMGCTIGSKVVYFTLTGCGRDILANPDHIPLIALEMPYLFPSSVLQ